MPPPQPLVNVPKTEYSIPTLPSRASTNPAAPIAMSSPNLFAKARPSKPSRGQSLNSNSFAANSNLPAPFTPNSLHTLSVLARLIKSDKMTYYGIIIQTSVRPLTAEQSTAGIQNSHFRASPIPALKRLAPVCHQSKDASDAP